MAHRGLVAGMVEDLGLAAGIDQATQHNPEARMVTVGQAVTAMALNGLGCVNQQRSLVPRFVHHTPTHRLMAPGMEATPLTDAT